MELLNSTHCDHYWLRVPLVDHLQHTWSLVDRRCQGLLVECTGETCSERRWVSVWVGTRSQYTLNQHWVLQSVEHCVLGLVTTFTCSVLWLLFSHALYTGAWIRIALMSCHPWSSTVYTQYWPSTARPVTLPKVQSIESHLQFHLLL